MDADLSGHWCHLSELHSHSTLDALVRRAARKPAGAFSGRGATSRAHQAMTAQRGRTSGLTPRRQRRRYQAGESRYGGASNRGSTKQRRYGRRDPPSVAG